MQWDEEFLQVIGEGDLYSIFWFEDTKHDFLVEIELFDVDLAFKAKRSSIFADHFNGHLGILWQVLSHKAVDDWVSVQLHLDEAGFNVTSRVDLN